MATAFDRFDANLDGALGLNCFWHLNTSREVFCRRRSFPAWGAGLAFGS